MTETAGDGTFVNLLVREGPCGQRRNPAPLVRETVDGQNRRLSYEQVAEHRLDKSTNDCQTYSTQTLSHEEGEVLREAARRYHRYRGAYQSCQLCEIVLHLLEAMNPVAVRPSGGIYFVPGEHEGDLAKLQTFVRSLGNGSDLWTMPVLDSADARMLSVLIVPLRSGKPPASCLAGGLGLLQFRIGMVPYRPDVAAPRETTWLDGWPVQVCTRRMRSSRSARPSTARLRRRPAPSE